MLCGEYVEAEVPFVIPSLKTHAMSDCAKEPSASAKGAVPAGHPGAAAEASGVGGTTDSNETNSAAMSTVAIVLTVPNLLGVLDVIVGTIFPA